MFIEVLPISPIGDLLNIHETLLHFTQLQDQLRGRVLPENFQSLIRANKFQIFGGVSQQMLQNQTREFQLRKRKCRGREEG